MAEQLPPDLSRLGDEIDRATARRLRARRRRAERRRRIAVTVLAATAAAVAIGPAALQPATRNADDALASTGRAYEPKSCDKPRGATFAVARPCATPGATTLSDDPLARRYAVQ